MSDAALERARAGDAGAFIDLVRVHDPALRRSGASDDARLRAYVEAYRALPGYADEPPFAEWLSGFVGRRDADAAAAVDPRFWARLAGALASEAPALAPPELPQRRFPVVPGLSDVPRGRRRRRPRP